LSLERPGILLVDDEPNILKTLERSLRNTSWTLYTAPGGKEGLAVLEREHVQVVVSDFRMTGMDGITFLNFVKEMRPDVQRVMLTGHADGRAVERAVNESEVYRFVNKPWNDAQLRAVIKDCLEHYNLLESIRQYEAELAERNAELEAANMDLENRVAERTRALIQAEKMVALGRMASGVAHEINNPLGGILAFAQVLIRDGGSYDPQSKEALDTIYSCALRCKEIINDLLSFVRKPTDEDSQLLDINQVALDALVFARLDPVGRDIRVIENLDENSPPVLGIPSLLQQVVVNLLQNAFQASSPGQAVILRTRAGAGAVTLEVEDSGDGIPEEIRSQIFEPFFTTKEALQGTGLGLFISYGIAREHGGELNVESEKGRGSKFTLKLPEAAYREEERTR
jgi:signal transduction histidine kinase